MRPHFFGKITVWTNRFLCSLRIDIMHLSSWCLKRSWAKDLFRVSVVSVVHLDTSTRKQWLDLFAVWVGSKSQTFRCRNPAGWSLRMLNTYFQATLIRFGCVKHIQSGEALPLWWEQKCVPAALSCCECLRHAACECVGCCESGMRLASCFGCSDSNLCQVLLLHHWTNNLFAQTPALEIRFSCWP